MTAPDQCPRCHARHLVAAELRGDVQVVLPGGHDSALVARVCQACGHVELLAAHPHPKGGGQGTGEVQEYDY